MRSSTLFLALLTMGCQLDGTSQPCPFDLQGELEHQSAASIALRDLTPFEWTEVSVIGEYRPADDVRALGVDYHANWDHVPEGAAALVFLNGESPVCVHTWHWRRSSYGFLPVKDFDPKDPVLVRNPPRR